MTDKGRKLFYVELRQWKDFSYMSAMELQTNWWSYFDLEDDDIMLTAIRRWKRREASAPTVANIEEIVKVIHHERDQREYVPPVSYDPNQMSVRCKECNDHGYVTIIYPSKVEAVRPCSCRASERYSGLKNRPHRDYDEFEAIYLFDLADDENGPSAVQKLKKAKIIETVKNPMRNPDPEKCGPGVITITLEVKIK